ncbi:MAG TPA: lipopolysaccharide biosynthesis protein [Usitatibacter sp.]|nr:lipopolysaccharide biosynthesis protein [Usitatibacter sp.]
MSPSASLERRAISLGSAYAIDYGLQFILPMVLTRALDRYEFGEYRLLWLATSTLLMVMPMCMPQSLYYFMPRSDARGRRLYLHQCLVFLALAALVSAWIMSPLDPWLPVSMHGLMTDAGGVVPLFTALWVFSWVLDVLPTVDERVQWQAKAIVGLSAMRALALSGAALMTGDLVAVLWVLAAFTGFKATLLLVYVARFHGMAGPWIEKKPFAEQLKQAAPFALSGGLHGLRAQGDQWIAATLFSVTQFASFSVATVMAPMVQMFRQSVNHVFMPSMSRVHSTGDLRTMLSLNSRANAMVALLVYPLLAFAFAFAQPLISLIYTSAYVDAVPVLRIYVVGLIAMVVEVVSLLFLLKEGPFAARVNALVLAVAIPASYLGAVTLGLPGAAFGSVGAIYLERALSLARISSRTEIRLRDLQDWATLGGILGAAVLSASVAALALRSTSWTALPTLAAGATLLAIVYPGALLLTGQRRSLTSFIASLRHTGAQPAPAAE